MVPIRAQVDGWVTKRLSAGYTCKKIKQNSAQDFLRGIAF